MDKESETKFLGMEKRRSVRVPVELIISCDHVKEVCSGYSTDISLHGIAVRTNNKNCKPGQIIDFKLQPKDSSNNFSIQAKVIWKKILNDDDIDFPIHCGLEFVSLSAEAQKLIEKIVKNKIPSSSTKKLNDNREKRLLKELEELSKRVENGNCYEILGVKPDASLEEIKKAYQEIMKRYHPDRYPQAKFSKYIISLVSDIFTKITDSYQILSNEDLRRSYDERMNQINKYKYQIAFSKAKTYIKAGKYQEALEKFKEALKEQPDNKECKVQIIWCKYKLNNNPEETKLYLKDFIKEFPEYALPYYYYGLILKSEGKMKEALVHFIKATKYDEKFIEAQREVRLLSSKQNLSNESPKKRRSIFSFFKKK